MIQHHWLSVRSSGDVVTIIAGVTFDLAVIQWTTSSVRSTIWRWWWRQHCRSGILSPVYMVTTTIGLTYGSTMMKRSSQPVWRFIRWWCLDHYHRCDVWSGDVLPKIAGASFYLDVMSWPPHLVRRFFGGIVLIRTIGFTISPMIWLGRRKYCIFIIQFKSSIILILIALVSWLH